MIWKPFIARELLVLVLTIAAFLSFGGRADKQRKARALPDGRLEFARNRRSFLVWPLLIAYSICATISHLMHLHRSPLNLMIAVCLGMLAIVFALRFPENIITSTEGLEQVFWLWRNKQIRWKDIVEINTGGKSRAVTITGVDGTKIVHDHKLPDRSRLLVELKHHCGENLPSDFAECDPIETKTGEGISTNHKR